MSDPKYPNAEYLGDAVYADYDGFMVRLTTDSHRPEEAGNTIYLEPQIIEALMNYYKRKTDA